MSELERLREALAFYANPDNWKQADDPFHYRLMVNDDYEQIYENGDSVFAGRRAKEALEL